MQAGELSDESSLEHFRELDLSHNFLTRVPVWLPAGLVALYIADNRLVEIPEWLGNCMTELAFLDAHLNSLLTIPVSMQNLGKLRLLGLTENPMVDGGGKLASAVAAGLPAEEILKTLARMTKPDWVEEYRLCGLFAY